LLWHSTGETGRRCPLADHPEIQPHDSELESGPFLTDPDVGVTKAPIVPLTFGPRFDRLALAAAVVFQVSILVAMILGRTVPYVGAQTVLLRVEPVDPRDMFRGDYVTLGYDISRTPPGKYEPGRPVYVALVPEAGGRHYRAGEFFAEPPASGVYIRGTAQAHGRANYGIESFYVQEGTGHDYEHAVRNRRLWAEIALDGRGTPALERLVIE
jgi:uncharacterized membrane-anchored protein